MIADFAKSITAVCLPAVDTAIAAQVADVSSYRHGNQLSIRASVCQPRGFRASWLQLP